MNDSMITRCPKCSTAFRVGADVLSMAKGKVRCGQCFHIFVAEPTPATPDPSPIQKVAKPQKNSLVREVASSSIDDRPSLPQATKSAPLFTSAEEEDPINPEWLQTLFDDNDLSPIDRLDEHSNLNQRALNAAKQTESDLDDIPLDAYHNKHQASKISPNNDEPAAWEREYADIQQNTPTIDIPSTPITTRALSTNNTLVTDDTFASKNISTYAHEEPDYMLALHSLAQSIDQQQRQESPSTNLLTKAAEENLAPLLATDTPNTPSKHTFIWLIALLISFIIALTQTTQLFFEQGSRSTTFRPFYKTWCSYTGCTLPSYEDINAINIQHVRIQSHPEVENALLVNAIMTNTSDFSQPMPKIALEFFDLNGAPVAARLFGPQHFLHKDFLDITYMPPHTPIHLVIPILDPGAQAVTHLLKVHSNGTISY